jgi:hypothetical protein
VISFPKLRATSRQAASTARLTSTVAGRSRAATRPGATSSTAAGARRHNVFDVRLIWISIILALIIPWLVGVRLLPSSW